MELVRVDGAKEADGASSNDAARRTRWDVFIVMVFCCLFRAKERDEIIIYDN
jgi:hypothetical protein